MMLGRTVTGGTNMEVITAHSGLHVSGLTPIFLSSLSGILARISLISVGNNLFFPRWKVVGFSTFVFSFAAPQYGHFLASFAFFALSLAEYFARSFSDIINFPHSLQKHLNPSSISATYSRCIIDLAKSMLPGCPRHSFNLPPHVLHLTPGSIAPSLKSINPPATGYPSIS